MIESGETERLISRADDLVRYAEKHGSAVSGFLDAASVRAVGEHLSRLGLAARGLSYCFFGGYAGAERQVLVIVDTAFCPYGYFCGECLTRAGAELPEWRVSTEVIGGCGDYGYDGNYAYDGGYAYGGNDDHNGGCDHCGSENYGGDTDVGGTDGGAARSGETGHDADISPDVETNRGMQLCPTAAEAAGLRYVHVRGSGYYELDHRSFLGAVLALGLSRDTVGDIIVRDGREAIIITVRAAAELLLSQPPVLTYVGRDKVRVSETALPPDYEPERRFTELSITVASPRLDAVVSELARLSRDKAKAAVTGGAVAVSGRVEQRPDREVVRGDVLSVRGHGKFVIGESGTTSRGRVRLAVKKYI